MYKNKVLVIGSADNQSADNRKSSVLSIYTKNNDNKKQKKIVWPKCTVPVFGRINHCFVRN